MSMADNQPLVSPRGMSALPAAARSATLSAWDLRCDRRATPLGIGNRVPRLSWRLASDRRGDRPIAFRVRVERMRSTAPAEPAELAWDTGWRPTDIPWVDYTGAPLESAARYRWAVQLKDVDGADTPAETSWFETGLLDDSDWHAAWIEHDPARRALVDPPEESEPHALSTFLPPPTYLRRTFSTASPVARATAFVTARGLYQLHVNGQRVGCDELTPGWTDYRNRVTYQAYDVTELLRDGDNVLGAILADGWFAGCVGYDLRRRALHYGARPQLLAQLILVHADGTRSVIGTDARWLESTGPLRYADLLMGECYDARLEQPGWSTPDFDASNWTPARIADHNLSTVVASTDEPVRVTELIAARSVANAPSGAVIVDFGQNVSGRVGLDLEGLPNGTQIRLRHGEMLDDKGELYTENLRSAEATDTFICGDTARHDVRPTFTVHGFRYAEITGLPDGYALPPDAAVAEVLHSDLEPAGTFWCSDEDVNQLQSNIRWGLRSNFVSVPTDCPQRDERLGWLADAQVFMPTAAYNADVAAFVDRWLYDVVEAQNSDGSFPDVAPRLTHDSDGAPAWADAGVIIPWHHYRTYGDDRLLRRCLPAMQRFVDFVHRANPDLVWTRRVGAHYGGWLAVGSRTDRDLLATAYFAHSADLVARASAVCGQEEQTRRYSALCADIKASFVERFVAADGRMVGDSQTAYLLALAFDLVPHALRGPVADQLVANLERHDRLLTTGFVGVALLCPVLTAIGRSDLAYASLHDDRFPSWGYSVRRGATTIWERWNGWTEHDGFGPAAMNSFNHYSLGSIGEWLFSDVAGIAQAADSVGYNRLLIRPRPGGRIRAARTFYLAPRGTIATAWELDDATLRLSVEVPPGTDALVILPVSSDTDIRLDGTPLPPGRAGEYDRQVAIQVSSGSYTFTCPAPHGAAQASEHSQSELRADRQ